jgi:hypothetical protein
VYLCKFGAEKPVQKRRKVIEPLPPLIENETEHANIPEHYSPDHYMDMPMDGDMGLGLAGGEKSYIVLEIPFTPL